MKVLINVTELLAAYPELDLVAVQDDLADFGAEFTEKEADGVSYLEVVCENPEDFDYAFENTGHITDIDAYIIDDEADYPDFNTPTDYPDYDDVDAGEEIPDYDSVDECDLTEEELYEKKKNDCCPKKKIKKSQQYISLSEALGLTKKQSYRKASLNELIDSISGKRPQRAIIEKALAKAKKGNKVNEARKHLGEKRYKMIMEALEQQRPTLHQNISINKKKMEEYSTEELYVILEKVDAQIKKLQEQMKGINETDALAKFEKELQNKQKMHTILEDEITYRKSYLKEADDENDFAKLFPEMKPENDEDKKDDDKSSDEEASDEEAGDDEEKNPDEDEEIELNAVVITLASEEDANNLKQDLVDAGVPEDVIEIAPVGEDEEEETEEDEESSEEEPAEEESDKKEESLRFKGKKMNEADDDEETEQADDEAAADAEADEEKADDEEKAEGEYKLTLTDTDYIEELADVLENIWGMEKSEFEELIGGEIVTKDEDEEDNEEGDKEESDDKSGEDDEKDDDDITPEELFKGL